MPALQAHAFLQICSKDDVLLRVQPGSSRQAPAACCPDAQAKRLRGAFLKLGWILAQRALRPNAAHLFQRCVSILSPKLRMPRAHACTIIPRRQHMDCLKIKNPPLSQDFDGFWSECGDSNPGPPAPKAGALPTAQHPVLFPGQTGLLSAPSLFHCLSFKKVLLFSKNAHAYIV